MNTKFKILLFILTIFCLSNCGGSGSQADPRLIVFTLGDNLIPAANINLSLQDDILYNQDYFYEVEIYKTVNDSLGQKVDGPIAAEEYNIGDNSYFINSSLFKGTYSIIFRLIKVFTETTDSIILYSVENHITIDDNITDIDLSESVWNYEFDADEDGLTNFDELNKGTNPLNIDTDGDGFPDNEDIFPTDPSESADQDSDNIGSNRDNCPNTSNSDQGDKDADGIGDVCDDDRDNDGILNDEDNCPELSNSTQLNSDKDSQGDLCDDDRDGDGLSNAEEESKGTDPDKADTDGDGVNDKVDAFPINSSESSDTDMDSLGDNSDNCLNKPNPDQHDTDSDLQGDACDSDDDNDGIADENDNCPTTVAGDSFSLDPTDQTDNDSDGYGVACDCQDSDDGINPSAQDNPDPQVQDTNCDGIDGDKNKAIFITPTDDLQSAINEATYDIYLSTGTYDVTDLNLNDGVSLYGGFNSEFTNRGALVTTNSQTIINLTDSSVNGSQDWAIGLDIVDFSSSITLASLLLNNVTNHEQQVVLNIENSEVLLQNIKIIGNSSSKIEILVSTSNSEINIQASYIEGKAFEVSTGVQSTESTGSLLNNIFNMGLGDNTMAIDLIGSDLNIINNTIDGGRHEYGTAFGLNLTDSSPEIINNIFITENSNLQSSIRCQGDATPIPVKLENNLFLRYAENGIIFPAYITCQFGNDHLTNISNLQDAKYSSELDAKSNTVDNRTQDINNISNGLGTILDTNYNLVETTTVYARDQGQDTISYQVTEDYFGNSRNDGVYDRGANEY